MLDQVFTLYAPDMIPMIQNMISYQSPYLQTIVISAALVVAIAVFVPVSPFLSEIFFAQCGC